MSFIEVKDLCKDYRIAKSGKGLTGAVKSLFHREYTVKNAVKNVSFDIERGEIVGYIGPNGAGKSTTIKMLSGVLIPTSGTVTVDGIVPYESRRKNAERIGVVFGQRSQLYWDLPISDTFDLYESLYDVPKETFRKNCDFFTELLGMGDFLNQPVRQLSLGQKMKANIAIALLHDPSVLYLDEPTIGLDVTSKTVLREAIKTINHEKGTTIMLTTHDMDDIEAVCSRLILIDKGTKLFDGTLDNFKTRYKKDVTVKLEFEGNVPDIQPPAGFTVAERDKHMLMLCTERGSSRDAMIELIRVYNPQNIYAIEPRIEDIVREIFG
ncbi:MAG TPA: ATP-binding cassette domain-containing protein [Candidatus Merdibacter merdigallinarum]|nr:ATP-binding cassette domain-containing protein [Candidatus Merdibacter merdigallinarum]